MRSNIVQIAKCLTQTQIWSAEADQKMDGAWTTPPPLPIFYLLIIFKFKDSSLFSSFCKFLMAIRGYLSIYAI